MPKAQWEALPQEVRQAVQEQTEAIVKTEPVAEGVNSDTAFVAHTRSGRLFVKGSKTDGANAERRTRSLNRELSISSHVSAISPALVGHVETAGWKLLVWEYIDGRRIDYSPGSPDLAAMVETLTTLSTVPAPGELDLPRLETRMANFTPAEQLWRFVGGALLHTDLNPGNVRMSGGRAYLVDWACPTTGIAWAEAFDLGLCLITCGHTPRDAEQIISNIPTWAQASAESVLVCAQSTEATWTGLYSTVTDDTWINSTVQAAQRWAHYRRGTG